MCVSTLIPVPIGQVENKSDGEVKPFRGMGRALPWRSSSEEDIG